MVADRKRVQRELRNAERKRSRLREKAKMLTDDDLVAVLKLREERRERPPSVPVPGEATVLADSLVAEVVAKAAANEAAAGGTPKVPEEEEKAAYEECEQSAFEEQI